MRPILFVLSALIVMTASSSFARTPKKPAAAAKKPPASAPAPSAPEPSSAPAASNDSGGGGGAPSMRGPARIDFDDRLIQGQSNKSGAVYLYDRKELKIRSMIKKRENFRDEIVGSLYDT